MQFWEIALNSCEHFWIIQNKRKRSEFCMQQWIGFVRSSEIFPSKTCRVSKNLPVERASKALRASGALSELQELRELLEPWESLWHSKSFWCLEKTCYFERVHAILRAFSKSLDVFKCLSSNPNYLLKKTSGTMISWEQINQFSVVLWSCLLWSLIRETCEELQESF